MYQLKGAPTDFNTTYFTNGNAQILDKYIKNKQINIVDSEYVPGWYRNEAYKIIKTYLIKEKISQLCLYKMMIWAGL